MYLALRVVGPDIMALWRGFTLPAPSYPLMTPYMNRLENFYCDMSNSGDETQLLAARMAEWWKMAHRWIFLFENNQLNLLKVLFTFLVAVIPSSAFRLLMVIVLMTFKWIEMGVDSRFGADVLVLVGVLVLYMGRAN